MAYEPTEWKTNDVITAEKLNKMENGIANASGVMLVTITEDNDTYVSDKSYEEIAAAIESGVVPVFEADGQYLYLSEDDPEVGLSADSNPHFYTTGIAGTSLFFSKEGEITLHGNSTNSSGLVLYVVQHGEEPPTLSARAGAIYDAFMNGIRVVVMYSERISADEEETTMYPVYDCGHNNETGEYYFAVTNYSDAEDMTFFAQSADDFPSEASS